MKINNRLMGLSLILIGILSLIIFNIMGWPHTILYFIIGWGLGIGSVGD